MHLGRVIGIGALALVISALPARADSLFTPYIGPNFGGQTVEDRLNYGLSFGSMRGGAIGFEIDLSHSPRFHGRLPFGTFARSRVTTLMGNIVLGVPIGGEWGTGVRPYATGGLGLMRMRTAGEADFTRHDAAANVGAGLMAFMGDNVGLRADLRYFRNFDRIEELDLGHFDYWRGSFGLVFRWR
jgi:hypothetical protein